VTRRDLCPNDWRDIWPELADSFGAQVAAEGSPPAVQVGNAATGEASEPGVGGLERAMADAAKAGLVERRHHVRRAEDRQARAGGKYREHGV